MQPSDRHAASIRAAVPDDFIDRLVEEMVGAAGGGAARDDIDLAIVEERLTQLRELSESEPQGASPAVDDAQPGPSLSEPAPHPALPRPPAPTAAPAAPVTEAAPPVAEAAAVPDAPAPAQGVEAGSVDAVILEAAHASGFEPVFVRASAERQAPARRRRSHAGYYLVALVLVALSCGLFVFDRPLFDNAVNVLEDYWLAGRDAAGSTAAAPIELPPTSPEPLPPQLLEASSQAQPEVLIPVESAPVWRSRKVKTYRVDADGTVDYGDTAMALD